VWLIDLVSGTPEIHREPTPRGYRQLLRPERSEAITPALMANVHLPLGEIWPA
jgi:Uma2 family endonuclease